MRTSILLFRFGVTLLCAGTANAGYIIEDTFNTDNFFTEFDFFADKDPTEGFVKYLAPAAANISSLAGYVNDAIFLGVDHTTVNPPQGRSSVRVSSKKAYTHGLIIADISHMPDSQCGSWPAFWTVGKDWPKNGEIDILEGVNDDTTNHITLHTSPGCNLNSTGALPSSTLSTPNCNAGGAGEGCSLKTTNKQAYGTAFNAAGGGVYAMEWTSAAIKVFFFARNSIPADIISGNPDPSTWGAPVGSFSGSGCSIDSHFKDHQIVFNTSLCGVWAGKVWKDGSCAALAPTCEAYVAANPQAFAQAYWLIKSVKVYKANMATGKRHIPFSA
ncbi:related to mixed-linked glucanase precursor MLG1 [Rhynchosporium secalis]|uniref:endo-1,3(4)-beta-glucanase n=1 Tax=Rhynchosporium secalis TaxID=38038 RepID=A0A1E1MV76_RHYSE|nr:related to mixed-linked glucanase precursor MLG1 [Rhynchosporium secalis]